MATTSTIPGMTGPNASPFTTNSPLMSGPSNPSSFIPGGTGSHTNSFTNAIGNGAMSFTGAAAPQGNFIPGTSSVAGFDPNSLTPGGTNFNAATSFSIPNIDVGKSLGFQGLDTKDGKTFLKNLQSLYGRGVGSQLWTFLSSGAGYNPQVAQSLIAQMGPSVARGDAQIRDAFGDEGARFSSSAAVGLGDFYSQVQQQINTTVSGLYEQAVQNYISVLTGFQGGAQQQNAQKG